MQQKGYHLERFKDETCAREYALAVLNRFDVLSEPQDPIELQDTIKSETLAAAEQCIRRHLRSRGGFISQETLDAREESHAARLAGSRNQYRTLLRRTRGLPRRDKGRYVRGIAEIVEGHLNANDLRTTYRSLKKLRSKFTSQVSTIRTVDICLMLDADEYRARWADYFDSCIWQTRLGERHPTSGVTVVASDPQINEDASSLAEVGEAVAGLRVGKVSSVCGISGELLKAGDEAMI